MKENILIINICKEKLHYFEFVKPIEDILKENNVKFFTRHYKNIKGGDFGNASKIIICGTSLLDNEFVKDINCFRWIALTDKPILGICGGMQLIGLVFEGKIKKQTEIGFYREKFIKEFLGLNKEQEVYHLHNNHLQFDKLKEFEVFCENNLVVQAVKHKSKGIYGVLFHPEVRQKELILNFMSEK